MLTRPHIPTFLAETAAAVSILPWRQVVETVHPNGSVRALARRLAS